MDINEMIEGFNRDAETISARLSEIAQQMPGAQHLSYAMLGCREGLDGMFSIQQKIPVEEYGELRQQMMDVYEQLNNYYNQLLDAGY